jgi:hypothetical protein
MSLRGLKGRGNLETSDFRLLRQAHKDKLRLTYERLQKI